MFERKKDGSDRNAGDSAQQDYQAGSGSAPSRPSTNTAPASRGDAAVIGRSIQIDGDLRGEEDLRIEGDVNGTVQLRNNTLTIGSEGKISANVYAKSVTVDGLMEGDVFGSESVSIRKNAQVRGNITAPRVSLEDGARFKGSIEMDSAAVEAAFAQMSKAAGGAAVSSVSSSAQATGSNGKRSNKTEASAHKAQAKSGSLI